MRGLFNPILMKSVEDWLLLSPVHHTAIGRHDEQRTFPPTRRRRGVDERQDVVSSTQYKLNKTISQGTGGAETNTVQWTVRVAEPSEQMKDASWSDDSRGKRSGFHIAN